MQDFNMTPTQIITGLAGIGLIFKGIVDHLQGKDKRDNVEEQQKEILEAIKEVRAMVQHVEDIHTGPLAIEDGEYKWYSRDLQKSSLKALHKVSNTLQIHGQMLHDMENALKRIEVKDK